MGINIGIVTFTDGTNYGQRLQNLAVQCIFESMGHSVKTFVLRRPDYGVFNGIKRSIKCLLHLKSTTESFIRGAKFNRFNKQYLKFYTHKIHTNYTKTNIDIDFDLVFAGSDQVWNPNSAWVTDVNFLTFVPSYKRAAIAASFSVTKIPEDRIREYKTFINEIPYITVRENSGACIIRDLCDRVVPVILDPTLIVDPDLWKSISKKPVRQLPKKYVVDYMLGNSVNDNVIKEWASKNGAEIVELKKGSQWYRTAPDEFLYILEHAEYIFTDSYHGTIFSIIFEKPFKNIVRQDNNISMHTRFETLYSSLGIEQQVVTSSDTNINVDYTNVTQRIQNERNRSLKIIRDIFRDYCDCGENNEE